MKDHKTVGGERLRAFFDAGTFVELGAYMCRPGAVDEAEGVVCGYGALSGRLVFAFAQDSSSMKGALDARHAEKIALVYEKALAVGAPVVGMFDCSGAVVFDGAAALSGYGRLLRAVTGASGKVPQVALITGVCAGTMAAVAALFDFTVVVKGKSSLYVTAPALLDAPAESAGADAVYENGNADLLCADEPAAFAAVARLLRCLPDCACSGTPAGEKGDDPNRACALGTRATAAEALSDLVDAGSFLELTAGVAPQTKTGFAFVGGVGTAVVALDDKLALPGLRKLTRFLTFANRFSLPVLTLVNCGGLASSAADEPRMAGALADLARALSSGAAARVTAIVGEAIGPGFLFGGARALGADLVLALPDAEISPLSAEAAVAFLWNDRVGAQTSRKALEAEWRATRATAAAAASTGEIDDIVEPIELRARLIAGLYMLRGKRSCRARG